MSLHLTSEDLAKLRGDRGSGTRMAMAIIVRMAEVQQTAELLDIEQAHIDSAIYIGDAGLEFAERLAALGARVAVPTTLNVSGLDEHHWREWAVPVEWATQAKRQMVAYQRMGCQPTWTCAPYQTSHAPRFGQQIAWGESNAIAFANSVIGARSERYPDFLDICAAVTGRVPATGLHLTENRAGDILLSLEDVPVALQQQDVFYPVLGYLVGQIAGDLIPVLTGLSVRPDEDRLKAFGAAAASSGSVALFHIAGVTPEAPTLDAAFQGREPRERIVIDKGRLREAWRQLTTSTGTALDLVVLGSPHFSLAEFRRLVPLLNGHRAHQNTRFLVTTSRMVAALAKEAGYLTALERFGGRITVDTCILASPMLPPDVRRLMTNSAKYAYYAPGLLKVEIAFGSLEECVRSAEEGVIVRDQSLWGGLS